MKNGIDRTATLWFVIILLMGAGSGGIWYFLSSGHYTTYQIRTQDSVSGLIPDAPIEFHGVEVGRVKRIELVDPHTVSILLSIENGTPITAATVATITSRGLSPRGFTGYVYISLEDVGTDFRNLVVQPGDKYPTISTAPSKYISLDSVISQLNEDVQSIIQLLHSLLDRDTLMSLKQSVESIRQITSTLADNNEKLKSLIVNTERASNQLKPLLESSSNAAKALQTQILPQAYKALSNLDNLSSSLTGLVTEISRDPSIFIRGAVPPPPGPGERR